jgi:membrane peptidoglycan carboxypeptidase
MVGNANYDDETAGQFNVTTAFRQPGSTMKLITYAAALSNGFTPATILDDSPISYPSSDGVPYAPVNYDGRFHGRLPLRFAFGNSINVTAVKTLAAIGLPVFIDTAKKMGLQNLGDVRLYGLSATLGGVNATMLDMATAFGTVANQGSRIDLNPIIKITDNTDAVIEQKYATQGFPALTRGVAFLIGNILSDNSARSMEFGPNSPLVIPNHTVSVKTGTSDDKRDNWTIGYVPNRVVTVWVGNNDNSPMSPNLASGITGAAPIWHTIMASLLEHVQDQKPAIPADVVNKQCGGHTEYFLKGTEDTPDCNFYWGATSPAVPKPT